MTKPNVTLTCDGEGWVGSFGIALQAFVEDVLSDGQPFEAEVSYEVDGGHVVTTDLVVAAWDASRAAIVTSMHAVIETEQIRRFSA